MPVIQEPLRVFLLEKLCNYFKLPITRYKYF